MQVKALLLQREGTSIENILMEALKRSGLLDRCYAYKSRVKSDEKLIEKVNIRRDDGIADYYISNITDVVGIRLMTLFRVDMVSIYESIIKIIKHDYDLAPNNFRKSSFEEIIFYTNRTNDKIHLALKEVAVKHDVDNKYKIVQREGEYSSIHIVARTDKKVRNIYDHDEVYYLPVEIQIRTVFEDAWGEVDHKYGYPIRKGKKTKYKVSNPQGVLRHLDALKRFSDACGEYADAIHLSILDENQDEGGKAPVRSVRADQETIDLFRALNIDESIVEKYIEARLLREDALSLKALETERADEKLIEASSIFNELAGREVNDIVDGHKIFYYYTKMNYAFCLLSTNSKQDAEEALKTYIELEKIYPEFILVKMRLSQAYEQCNYIELALKKCDEAYKSYKAIQEAGYVESISLPRADYDHIRSYLKKFYGYLLWLKACSISTTNTRLAILKVSILRKAYFLTLEAISENEDDPSLYNNILYYILDIINVINSNGHVRVRKDIIESIPIYMDTFERKADLYNTNKFVFLDTAIKVYHYLKNNVERDKAIERLERLALEKFGGNADMNEAVSEILREAREIKELAQK